MCSFAKQSATYKGRPLLERPPHLWTGRALQEESSSDGHAVRINLSGLCLRACALGHHGDPRAAVLIRSKASRAMCGARLSVQGRPLFHRLGFLSRTLARSQLPSAWQRRLLCLERSIVSACVIEHCPGNTSELVGHATARTFLCNLLDAAPSQRPKLFFSQPSDRWRTETGALNERGTRGSFPRQLMPPRIVRSPVEICFGTRPSQAAKSRPLLKCRTVADRRHHRACRYRTDTRNAHKALAVLVLFCEFLDLSRDVGNALIEAAPIVGKVFDRWMMRGNEDVGSPSEDRRQGLPQGAWSLTHRDVALEKRLDIFRWHQTHVVAKRDKLAANVMGSGEASMPMRQGECLPSASVVRRALVFRA